MRPLRPRRIEVVVMMIVLALVLGVATVAMTITGQGQTINDQGRRIDGLEQQRNLANEQARALADHVRQMGGVPKVSPPMPRRRLMIRSMPRSKSTWPPTRWPVPPGRRAST